MVFIASSSLNQMLKVANDLKSNGFQGMSFNFSESEIETKLNISVNFLDITRCDAIIFFNAKEMMVWQGAMLGAAIAHGKKIFCITPLRVEIEPILTLPQIEHFLSWNELRDQRFPLRKVFLRKRIGALRGRLGRLTKLNQTRNRVERIERIRKKLQFLRREFDEKFGVLSIHGGELDEDKD